VGEGELERLDELLAQAVDRCLQLGPAALHLSGGIDSATVAVVAADRSRRQGLPAPLALSVLFPDATCNEEAVQRAVGADLGLPHLLTSFDDAVGPGRLVTAALGISARSPAPLLNLFEPAFDHLGTAARQRGYRVVLTGGGGDEWLGLEPSYAVDLVRGFHLVGLYRLWEAKRRYLPLPAHVVFRNNVWRAGLRPVLRNFARRRAPWAVRAYKGRRDSDWIPAWIARNADLREELRSRDGGQRPPASASHYLHAKRRTLDHPVEAFVAEEAFAASQRLGLRRLEPFWDPDVVDLLCRTPPRLLIRGAREKSVVRGLLARNLPSIGREWPRTVFMDSFATSVMRSQGPAAWGRLDGASALVDLGVVDRERVRDFVEAYFAGTVRDTWRVWSILSVEAWLQARV
jgi:asparagine synthase (glutamine-hydrolysing)